MRRKPVVKLLRSIVKLRAVLRACGGDVAVRLKSHLGQHPPSPSGLLHSYEPVLRDFDNHLGAFAQFLADAEDGYGDAKARSRHRRAEHTRARALRSRVEAFEDACGAPEEADAALVTARDRANEAVARTRQVVGWVGGALENLCYLAAEPRIAERVRECVGG